VFAYAFLAKGAVEPLSGFVWHAGEDRERGAWVEADTAPTEALRGYPARDLPYWLDDELWNIELAGTLAERDHLLIAERARLLGRIDAWTDRLAWELVTACARRVAREAAAALRDDGRADSAERLEGTSDLHELELEATTAPADLGSVAERLAGSVADVCFYARDARVGARAAGIAAKMSAYALAGEAGDARGYGERVADERAWQAAWLVKRLGL
jgi:hypothetical protein